MKIPIIVPHFGSVELAGTFIQRFLENSSGKFELHFGWNGPEQIVPGSIKKFSSAKVKIYTILKPGSYSVRNHIINEIKDSYEYIAFTDSDCVLNSDYFTELENVIKERSEVIVVGDVQLFRKHGSSKLVYNYEHILEWDIERTAKKGGGITANIIVPSIVFKRFGLFNEDLMSGADNLFCKKISELHGICKYNSSLIVKHPSRDTLCSMGSKIERTYLGWFHIYGWHNKGKIFQFIASLYCLRPPIKPLKRIVQSNASIFQKLSAFFVLLILRLYTVKAHFRYIFNFT